MNTVSIFAGNPAVEVIKDPSTGEEKISVDPQSLAFTAALQQASKYGERVKMILVALDHIGDFNSDFLEKNIDTHKGTPLTLASLRQEIRAHFEEICVAHKIPLDRISIITEEEARRDAIGGVSKDDRRLMVRKEDEEGDDIFVPNCRAITAAIIARLASSGADTLRAFWQYHQKRVRPEVIHDGIEYSREIFGVSTPLRNTIIYNGSRVLHKEFPF